jgi:protein-S-isoprenylcysteine O-methyltransferase Ste14
VIVLGLFLFRTTLSKAAKLFTFLGTWLSYAALTGQIILSMSGTWLLIFPLVLPLQPLERWLGLNRTGFMPIRGTPVQDIVVPTLIALGFAITIVGLVQIVTATKRKSLATHGLYATMRHPQHLGIILWALGFALWGSHYLDFLIWFTLIYVLVLLAWHEEGKLEKQFGEDYLAYQGNTLFMIPFVPKRGILFRISNGKEIASLIGIFVIGIAAIFCVFYFFSVPWSPSPGHI